MDNTTHTPLIEFHNLVKDLHAVDIGDFRRKLLSDIIRLKNVLSPLKSQNEQFPSLYQELKVLLLSDCGEDIETLRIRVLEKLSYAGPS